MTTVIIWHGNPSSGGTGYQGTARGQLEAFSNACANMRQSREVPNEIFSHMARAGAIESPIVRIGSTIWSVEIRR